MCIFKSFQVLTVCTQVDSEAGVPQMAAEELLLEGVWAEVEWGSNSTVVVLNRSPAPPHPHCQPWCTVRDFTDSGASDFQGVGSRGPLKRS